MRRLAQLAKIFVSGFEFKSTGKWLILSALVGIVAGLGAIAFHYLCQGVLHVGLVELTGYTPQEPAGEHIRFDGGGATFSIWRVVILMAVGGLVSGLLVFSLAPEAEGHGTDAAIDSFHHKGGLIRPRIPAVKMIASAITLGTGGSGGREGPIAQIGGGFGSFLATYLKLPTRDRRILLAAGMGAGVGAIFQAPLAGALFAGEILYREMEFESDVIIPAAIASVISYTVFALSLPESARFLPLFGETTQFRMGSFLELIPLAILALVLVFSGILYIKVFYGTQRLFHKIPLPPALRASLGAALAGLFAAALYYAFEEDKSVLAVLSTGYGALQQSLEPGVGLSAAVLLTIAFGKIVTTSLTIGSGGSAGVFGPSMVIGGCIGGAMGQYFHDLWPEVVAQPGAYVIVGMAGFFAGCAHAPFSTLIMVSEMTGDYQLLLPAMWVCTLCFLLCRRWTLYQKQVSTRLASPAHRGDFIYDVLEGAQVRHVFTAERSFEVVTESTTLDEIVHKLAETNQSYFPVVNESGEFVGIFSDTDVRSYTIDRSIWSLAIARDLMVTDILSVVLDDDLHTALRRFTTRNIDELPVVSPENPRELIGMLRRKDTIAFYNRRLTEQKNERKE
jgi:CIC family chloride channel protein